MRSYLRLLWISIRAFFRSKNIEFSEESVLKFMVLPWDCVLRMAGNDIYHTFMDLGRIDLIIRQGVGTQMLKNRWELFVLTAHISYRYSLKMFDVFTLRTRMLYWDKYCFLMEHIFECGGRTIATAISKNVATYKNGLVKTSAILSMLKTKTPDPYYTETVKVISETESILRRLRR
jgi:acyl-CoA thioesterase FadM